MKHHKFWAWATVFCFAMVMYTGYKHEVTGMTVTVSYLYSYR